MDPIFHAGLKLGQAEACRKAGVDGSGHIKTAASEIRRADDRSLAGVARQLDDVGRAWKNRMTEIGSILAAIQKLGGATYHQVSSGLLMGQAMEACRQKINDDDLATVKATIGTWIGRARDHGYALKSQGFYPKMPDFRPQFNALITPIHLISSPAQFPTQYPLIEDVATKFGNAIR